MTADGTGIEAARLAELRALEVLDTAPDRAFDDVVTLAAGICETPVSLISLVDEDRQWFKARTGFDTDETPIAQSICAHAIQSDELLEIRDTREDPRTAGNPLVCDRSESMRFYAGAPLVLRSGHRIGTLCVLDTRPRVLTDLQRNALRVMAAQVARQLELARALRDQSILRDEIDHRVKNSLQAASSFVRLHRARARGAEAREVLDAVERRISAIAQLHAELYRTAGYDRVDLAHFLGRVCDLLRRQMPDGVTVTLDAAPIAAGSAVATALAIVISEFAANAVKHAFADGGTGDVRVAVAAQDNRGVRLVCTDNGPGGRGASSLVAEHEPAGIGTRLMFTAIEQIDGTLSLGPTETGYRLEAVIPDAGLRSVSDALKAAAP